MPGHGLLTFSVADVGQGLSQICVKNDTAVIWDIGPENGYSGFHDEYTRLEKPFISAIIISHAHEDHFGGLRMLKPDAGFSGMVVVSPFEDTSLIRSAASFLHNSIRFRTVCMGDTLCLLNGVIITCLWPPHSIESYESVAGHDTLNHQSLCFSLKMQNTSVLITGDIDSVAAANIAAEFKYGIRTDALIVPHHGSAGSLQPVFYGYAMPDVAVISCGKNNPYNHPDTSVTRFLSMQMCCLVFETRFDGTVSGVSNGEYWQWFLQNDIQ
jgi:competence protein ComEC